MSALDTLLKQIKTDSKQHHTAWQQAKEKPEKT